MKTRRDVVKSGAAALGVVAVSSCNIGNRKKPELRWLGWEHYDVRELREEFEQQFNCTVRAQYFDGNSEAWAKLRNGGADDFHLVMADGFWPRLYNSDGYTVPIDPSRVPTSIMFSMISRHRAIHCFSLEASLQILLLFRTAGVGMV